MKKLGNWAARLVLVVGSIGAIGAACHNDVPGPLSPVPPREVPPLGPSPGPILPLPGITADDDAGITLPKPMPEPMSMQVILRSSKQIGRQQSVVPHHPVDAGVLDTPADLPAEVPDADIAIVGDAAQPL